jgi:hypothetical protein
VCRGGLSVSISQAESRRHITLTWDNHLPHPLTTKNILRSQ